MKSFTRMSRREFFLASSIAFAPTMAGVEVKGAPPALAPAECRGDVEPSPAELSLDFQECPECSGIGRITCPACDGTGMWTKASESAGLYQREAARASGHCAWCDEWGEVRCVHCEGLGAASYNI
jgi:hypothetical protein